MGVCSTLELMCLVFKRIISSIKVLVLTLPTCRTSQVITDTIIRMLCRWAVDRLDLRVLSPVTTKLNSNFTRPRQLRDMVQYEWTQAWCIMDRDIQEFREAMMATTVWGIKIKEDLKAWASYHLKTWCIMEQWGDQTLQGCISSFQQVTSTTSSSSSKCLVQILNTKKGVLILMIKCIRGRRMPAQGCKWGTLQPW